MFNKRKIEYKIQEMYKAILSVIDMKERRLSERIDKIEKFLEEDCDECCDECNDNIAIISCDKCGVLLPKYYATAKAELVDGEAETIHYCSRCKK